MYIDPMSLLLVFHESFLFPFPFFFKKKICFSHPVVVIHEVVSGSFFCFSWLRKFVVVVFPSSFGSSYQSSCLDLVVKSKMPIEICLVHFSFGREAILLAIRHFSLLCVSIQHGILMLFMCSPASLVRLLMYSIQSSSFSVESIASWNDTSLSWS